MVAHAVVGEPATQLMALLSLSVDAPLIRCRPVTNDIGMVFKILSGVSLTIYCCYFARRTH